MGSVTTVLPQDPQRRACPAFPLRLCFSFLLYVFLRSKEIHHQFCITVKTPQLPENLSEASHPFLLPALGSWFPPVCLELVDVYLFKCTAYTWASLPTELEAGCIMQTRLERPGSREPRGPGQFSALSAHAHLPLTLKWWEGNARDHGHFNLRLPAKGQRRPPSFPKINSVAPSLSP